MITEKEIKELLNRKQPLIDSFDPAKKDRVYVLKDEILDQIKWHKQQKDQIEGVSGSLPADPSVAFQNLARFESNVVSPLRELKTLLSEIETSKLSRDTSDGGTIAGNGFVFFRSTGTFTVPSG